MVFPALKSFGSVFLVFSHRALLLWETSSAPSALPSDFLYRIGAEASCDLY